MEKRGKGIKIEHNGKLLLVIIFLLIVFVGLIWFIVNDKEGGEVLDEGCEFDSECAPASCCHPESCVSVSEVLDCGRVLCSQVCSGPLDCGAGHCGCVNNKCEVVSDEN